jgi:NADH:ubiquinone oxidoreductase subunit F (NADH-binding)
MCAAKKPRCWRASRASAASCAPSRRCRRSQGLFGQPTVINNVITWPRADDPGAGAGFYRDYGMGRSRGTLPFQLAGNIKHGGWWRRPSA